jgi:hypothetical protein
MLENYFWFSLVFLIIGLSSAQIFFRKKLSGKNGFLAVLAIFIGSIFWLPACAIFVYRYIPMYTTPIMQIGQKKEYVNFNGLTFDITNLDPDKDKEIIKWLKETNEEDR